MFYSISGSLIKLGVGYAVLETGGVGYRLTISQTTYDSMPPYLSVAQAPIARLLTYLVVRDDSVELFGFISEEELAVFKLLITVSGVGPKAAMSVLSIFNTQTLASIITSEDTKSLSKAPGIGAKTSARIVLELKDKISLVCSDFSDIKDDRTADVADSGGSGNFAQAVAALTGLGYSRAEAISAVKKVDASLSLGEIIRLSLKSLNKN